MPRGKQTPGDKRELVKSLIYLNPELSQHDVAKATGISQSTISNLMNDKDFMDDDTFNQYRLQKKRDQIVKALDIASAYIDHLKQPEVIEKASARDSAIVAGTMIDKAQLLAGEATVITENRKPIADLVKDTEVMLQELKQLTGS